MPAAGRASSGSAGIADPLCSFTEPVTVEGEQVVLSLQGGRAVPHQIRPTGERVRPGSCKAVSFRRASKGRCRRRGVFFLLSWTLPRSALPTPLCGRCTKRRASERQRAAPERSCAGARQRVTLGQPGRAADRHAKGSREHRRVQTRGCVCSVAKTGGGGAALEEARQAAGGTAVQSTSSACMDHNLRTSAPATTTTTRYACAAHCCEYCGVPARLAGAAPLWRRARTWTPAPLCVARTRQSSPPRMRLMQHAALPAHRFCAVSLGLTRRSRVSAPGSRPVCRRRGRSKRH